MSAGETKRYSFADTSASRLFLQDPESCSIPKTCRTPELFRALEGQVRLLSGGRIHGSFMVRNMTTGRWSPAGPRRHRPRHL